MRTTLLTRRVKLAGWLLAVLMLAAFGNLSVFPEQVRPQTSTGVACTRGALRSSLVWC